MNKELIGMASGLIMVLSVIPYTMSVWRRKTRPVVTSWALWSVIGFALLVTYKSSGAGDNVWPAVFGFINPVIITFAVIYRKNEWKPLTKTEKRCLVLCLASLLLWFLVRKDKSLAQLALYLAIAADLGAALPTIEWVFRNPDSDRPGAWLLFGIGYCLGMFAISEHTVSNYILPIYMTLGAGFVAYPLTAYRMRQKVPIREWI